LIEIASLVQEQLCPCNFDLTSDVLRSKSFQLCFRWLNPPNFLTRGSATWPHWLTPTL